MTSSNPGKKRVLFLCTGNSARSQLAQAIMRNIAGGRFHVESAGTEPRSTLHPDALAVLTSRHVDASGLLPKHVSTFDGQHFDYVITVCDRARERCPVFRDAEMIHWSFADPSGIEGDAERRRAFEAIFHGLSQRIRLLVIVSEKGES